MLSTVFEKVRSLFGFETESRKRRLDNIDCGESSTSKIRRIDRPLAFSNYFSGNLPSSSSMSKPDGRPQLHEREDPDLIYSWDKRSPGKENQFSWSSGKKVPDDDDDVVVLEDDYEEPRETKLHKRSSYFKSHTSGIPKVHTKAPVKNVKEVNLVDEEVDDVAIVKESSSRNEVQVVFPPRPSHRSLHSGRKSGMWSSSGGTFSDISAPKVPPKSTLESNFPFLNSGQKSVYGVGRLSLDHSARVNHERGTGSRLDSPSVKNRVRNGNLSRAAVLKRSLPPPPTYFGAVPKMSSRWSGLDDKMRKKTSALSLCSAIDEMKAYNHMLQQFTSESASKRLMTRLDGQVFKMFESQLKRNYSYSQLLKKRTGGERPVVVDTIDLSKSDDDVHEIECLDEAKVPHRKESSDCAIIHPAPRRIDVLRSREVTPKTSSEADVSEKSAPRKPPNAVEQMIKKSHVTDDEFLKDIMSRYSNEMDNIGKEVEKEKMKKQLWSERRQKFEGSLEERLKRYMKITEVILDEVADSEKEETLPELTKDMLIVVQEALKKGRSCVLASFGSSKITGGDLGTLNHAAWLNDEIMNNYLDMVTQRGQGDDYPSVYCFNTFFYERLSNSGYSSVKRWTKKVDIFAKDIVIIPLHLEIHWALAVVDFRQETICYYDSMNSSKGYILELIRRYLEDERMDKKKEKFDTSHWKLKLVQDIPQQKNGFDCGVFACMFAEHLSRGIVKGSKKSAKCKWSYPPFPFSQDNMPYFRKRIMYEILTGKILG